MKRGVGYFLRGWKWALLFLALPLYGEDNVIDEVIWVIGDEMVLKSEVETERLSAEYNQTPLEGDPYCVIPEELAVQKLFLHQAKMDSIQPSEEDVTQRVEAQLAYIVSQIGSKEKMEEYFNKSYADYKKELSETIKKQSIIRQMQQKIVGDVKVTPEEVRRFYRTIPQDSLPYIPLQVEVQLIALSPDIPFEEIDRVKNTLREIAEQVNKGEREFSNQAILYSEDYESARHGGELGFMGRGQLVPEFAEVAFALQDSKRVSRIVETEYGYHIIQLIEHRGAKVNCRHILMKPRIDNLAREKSLHRLDSIRVDILEGHSSFEKVAHSLSVDKESKNNGGIMKNSTSNNSLFEMQQLPPLIAKEVDAMEINDISQPFVMTSEKNGKEMCVIVKLKNRIQGHKANLTNDYQTIRSLLESKKREEKIREWILQKQKEVYVHIKEGWCNCDFKYPGWIQIK
ncbi:MAG TPA: peptidylprolyl isomerase [Porphyromonadaceae bacterium]|nr:peptidylprolyl isomerase [Porphyromonadaceae bacterium]